MFLPFYRFLELLRKIHNRFNTEEEDLSLTCTGQSASDHIRNLLLSNKPCMIARFGQVELDCTLNYLSIHSKTNVFRKIMDFVTDKNMGFWWESDIKTCMTRNAGFFPAESEYLSKFAELMLSCMQQVDILGSWRTKEKLIEGRLTKAIKIHLEDLPPYVHADPWSIALKNKKVLVVHPFSKSIQTQYVKREKLFNNKNVLPEFQLDTVTAVLSNAGQKTKYPDWFSALEDMQKQIAEKDFDVAIIGCGAYGFPLATFVKNLGKQAVHLGGATQILFGIKGRRWDKYYKYEDTLYNEYWTRPLPEETPQDSQSVEGGCYW